MDGTEIKASDLLQKLKAQVLTIDKADFAATYLFGDPDGMQDLLEVAETLILDALFCAANRLGAMGIHFWTAQFPALYTLFLQFYLRGYVLGHMANSEINEERVRIEAYLVALGEALDNEGYRFVPVLDEDGPSFEEIDNPFRED